MLFFSPVRNPTACAWPAWLAICVVTLAVYWPGLYGDFLFDDVHVIVDNPTLAIDEVSGAALLDAAFSTHTGPLRRPLALLSFAANRTLNGSGAFAFKLTNVLLHALNAGLLMLVLLRVLPRLLDLPPARAAMLARLTALLWAVHPANLSSVLYVVQRMTLAATTCMLLAMLAWLWLRRRQVEGPPVPAAAWALPVLAWLAALGFKESAAVLPAYLLALELATFRGRAWRRPRGWQWLGVVMLVSAVAAGAFLMLERIAADYAGRAFTLGERLMTEARVVLLYARMTVLPDPGLFALFHDDIALSHGLFAPPSTLASLLVLGLAAGVILRWRPPLLAFALAWFFSGHLMESTVLPLELAHEHRNYLAAAGLLLALVCGFEALARRYLRPRSAAVLAVALFALPVAVTVMRAGKWSDPWTQMATEAHYHPRSARSVYEYGRLSVLRAVAQGDTALYREGLAALERAATLNSPQPQIVPGSLLNQSIAAGNSERTAALTARIVADPRGWLRAYVLRTALECQVRGECPLQQAPISALAAVVIEDRSVPPAMRAAVLEWLAVYYVRLLGDIDGSIAVLREIVDEYPWYVAARVRLAEVLAANGQAAAARDMARAVLNAAPWYFTLTERPLYRRLRGVLEDTASGVGG